MYYMEKKNVTISKIKQMLAKLPGVDKDAKNTIEINDKTVEIKFSPLKYVINVYEIAKRVHSKVSEIINDNKYNISVIVA